MKELLISVLEQFCPDHVYLQGTLNPDDAYPQKFITFYTESTEDNSFYNNDVVTVDWYFAVMFYSDDPTEVNTIPAQISTAMKAAGFIPQGKGNDIMAESPTHTGWAMDFIYRETINSKKGE